ncbi:MAG TPA: hypothetical protein DEB24_01305, partial [Coriobacteriia bacterium]|nr:hypothetical protein [Coriobacteriia bacterium]
MDPLSTDTVSGQSRIKVWRAVLCVSLSLLLTLPPDLAHAAKPLRDFLDTPTAILPVPDDGTDDFASDDDADDCGGFDIDGATDGSDALSATGSADDPASEKPHIVGEEEGLREQNVKHFRLSDGSHVACDYGMPVHYRTDDGSLKDIDATLVRGEEGYGPANSVIDVVLPEDIAKSGGVALDDGVAPISWRYDVLPAFEKPAREGDGGAEGAANTGDSGA